MNDRDKLRALPLLPVFLLCGVQQEWKTRKQGNEWWGRCPVHNPKRNLGSFSFDSTGRFNCFSCGIKGKGAIDLVIALKKCSFTEAVDLLATVTTDTTPELNTHAPSKTPEESVNAPYKASYEKFYISSNWLKERGFTQETLDHYGVGEYNNPARKSAYTGCIMFPIKRFSDGACVGYLSRHPNPTEGLPKYLWPKGVAKHLEVFGSHELKRNELPLRVGYLVESPLCVLKFHQLGFRAVSPYGWSVSVEQALILSQLARGWIFLPDQDKRAEAVHQVLPLLASRCWVKCPQSPASDPEHLTKEQILTLSH